MAEKTKSLQSDTLALAKMSAHVALSGFESMLHHH